MSPKKFLRFLLHAPSMLRDLREIKSQARESAHSFEITKINPYPYEKKKQSGTASGHYFHQDLLVAQRIFENQPSRHVDIGSRVDGFVAHVASFRAIEVLDIRPLQANLKNINFRQADLMSPPSGMLEYCDSLSCLHAIEHFGLGRYGDPIDFEGHIKGLDSLYAILKPGGTLYLSTPIGQQRIEFNAHRVFELSYLLSILEGKFILKFFSYVDDKGDLYKNVELTHEGIVNSFGCHYGCGIFELEKSVA